MPTAAISATLAAKEWHERQSAHLARAQRHTLPARARSDRGLPHPIADFLFQYYPFPYSLLEHWHPGTGIALEWHGVELPPPFTPRHDTLSAGLISVDTGKITTKERQRLAWIAELLEATRDRAPNFACHGLHEWAMVYRGKQVRHERTLRLRLPQQEIDALVESRPLCCSHHDAFRFFATEARPFNRLQPDLDGRIRNEQPACLHANMDLYKWSAKSMPWIGSDLLLDCFELAVELRELDMRASPYDLTEWRRPAVRIETAEGRAEYECQQKRLAIHAQALRRNLIARIRQTLET